MTRRRADRLAIEDTTFQRLTVARKTPVRFTVGAKRVEMAASGRGLEAGPSEAVARFLAPVLACAVALLVAAGGGCTGGDDESAGGRNGAGSAGLGGPPADSTSTRSGRGSGNGEDGVGEPRTVDGALARADALASGGLPMAAAATVQAVLGRGDLPPSVRAAALKRLAELYASAGAWARAGDAARAAMAAGDSSPEIQCVLGDSLREESRLEEARDVFERVLASAAENEPAKLGLARVEFRLGDPAKAIPLFESFLGSEAAKGESLVVARLEYGRALRGSGRLEEAADELVLALEDDPANTDCLSELANVLYRLRRRNSAKFVEEIYRQRAENLFDHEVEEKLISAGREGLALSQRGLNLEREGRWLEALLAHRKAVDVAPKDARVRVYHATLCKRLHRFREAQQSLEEALRLGVEPASGLGLILGRVFLDRDEPARALEAFDQSKAALEREGDRGGAEMGQADPLPLELSTASALIELARPAEAARALERAATGTGEAAPAVWELDYWAGRVAMESFEPREAMRCFDRAGARGGKSFANLALWSAKARLAAGRPPSEAISALGLALRLEPGRVDVLETFLEAVRAAEASGEWEKRGGKPTGFPPEEDIVLALERARANDRQVRELYAKLEDAPLEESGGVHGAIGIRLAEARSADALPFLVIAHELEPGEPQVLDALLQLLRRDSEVFFRLRFARALLQIDPDHPRALQTVAVDCARLGVRLEFAEECARRLREKVPTADSWRLLAAVEDVQGRRDDARATLEEASRKFPADEAIAKALEALGH